MPPDHAQTSTFASWDEVVALNGRWLRRSGAPVHQRRIAGPLTAWTRLKKSFVHLSAMCFPRDGCRCDMGEGKRSKRIATTHSCERRKKTIPLFASSAYCVRPPRTQKRP